MTVTALTPQQARAARLHSMLLGSDRTSAPDDVAGVVRWFGAMQAQEYASGLWSFGVRLPGRSLADVEQALEEREALRTWPMRGTVHFVPSRDAHWMLEILGERPLAGAEKRREFLGLPASVADHAVDVLGGALVGGGRLTRKQCIEALEAAGISGAGQRGYHLLWYASQRGVTCIAPNVDGEQTFVLLDEWVPDPVRPDRDEALALLALRYFRSHGPARLQDLAGWTGLPITQVRRAAAACGDALVEVTVDGVVMLMTPEALDASAASVPALRRSVWALPGFDEYLLGVKDRSLVLGPGELEHVVPGGNGMFRATVVQAGEVVATWKRGTTTRRGLSLDVWPLRPASPSFRKAAERALQPYGSFVGTPLTVRWPD